MSPPNIAAPFVVESLLPIEPETKNAKSVELAGSSEVGPVPVPPDRI